MSEFEVGFESPCAFVPGLDPRRLFIHAATVEFTRSGTWILLRDAKKLCNVRFAAVQCKVDTPTAGKLQLPVLYYPDLLSVKVNTIARSVVPTQSDSFTVATVEIPAGESTILAWFQGSPAGNYISAGSFLIFFMGVPVVWSRFRERTTGEDNGDS